MDYNMIIVYIAGAFIIVVALVLKLRNDARIRRIRKEECAVYERRVKSIRELIGKMPNLDVDKVLSLAILPLEGNGTLERGFIDELKKMPTLSEKEFKYFMSIIKLDEISLNLYSRLEVAALRVLCGNYMVAVNHAHGIYYTATDEYGNKWAI